MSDSESSHRLTVAIPTVASDVLIHLAQAKGYFKQHGVDITIMEDTAATTPSLIGSGQAEIAIFAAATPLAMADKGKATSIIYGLGGGGQGGRYSARR